MKRTTLTICPECKRANTNDEEICHHCGTSLLDETAGPLINNDLLSISGASSVSTKILEDNNSFPPVKTDENFTPSSELTSDQHKLTNPHGQPSTLIDLMWYRLRLALNEIGDNWKLTWSESTRLSALIGELIQTSNRNMSSTRWWNIFLISLRAFVQFLRLLLFVIASLLLSVLLLVTFFIGIPVVHRTIRLKSPTWYTRGALILGGIVVLCIIVRALS